MSDRAQWPCATRLRDKIANYGHAMPIGLGKLCIGCGTGSCNAPIFVFAHGRSVPISRGSPPSSQ